MTLKHRLDWYDSPEGAAEYLEEYEKLHRRLSDRRERRLLEHWFDGIGQLEIGVDLPCGWGRYLPFLRAHCHRVLLADYSSEMLALSRKLRPDAAVLGRFRATGWALPLPDASADLVFSMRLNHHLADPVLRRKHLTEVFRVARRFTVFSFFDSGTVKNRLRNLRIRMGSSKRPKSTLSFGEVQAMAEVAGFRIREAPLLFAVGSGHRLVLAERAD